MIVSNVQTRPYATHALKKVENRSNQNHSNSVNFGNGTPLAFAPVASLMVLFTVGSAAIGAVAEYCSLKPQIDRLKATVVSADSLFDRADSLENVAASTMKKPQADSFAKAAAGELVKAKLVIRNAAKNLK